MGSPVKKRMRVLETKEDRISRLPDELIHKVLSFVDAKEALQTSVLSKRWKLIWTTLPFLNIGEYQHSSPENTYGFIRHVLSNRNHQSRISQLKLCSSESKPPDSLVEKFVEYAIEHNVQDLNLKLLYHHDSYNLSTLSSNSLNKLTLEVNVVDFASESDYWNLPALTYLCLVRPMYHPLGSITDVFRKLPESCLTCLAALKSLCLKDWNLLTSFFSFGLPDLTTLRLSRCRDLPLGIWNFPALSSLELDNVDFRQNMNAIFPTLVHLQNLTLYLTRSNMEQHHLVSSPQLLNLIIKIGPSDSLYGNIKVLAPKLRNFSSVGILSITLDVPELENVHIELRRGWIGNEDWIYRKKIYRLFTDMLSGLGNAKNLTFDFNSIQALSSADFLASLTSPFYNLEIVKLPPRYEESSMSGALRTYLLGGSPKATIVTTLYKNNVTQPVSRTSQKAMLDGPFAVSTNVNSVVDADRMRQIGTPVAGTSNDRASSFRGDTDFGLWHGHEVNIEFVGLLDLIMKNYPQTFEHFTAKSERFHTVMLNMLCTSVNEFLGTSMTEVSTDTITECRNLFADLQRWGFNVVWLVSHLNYVEQLLFSQHEHHAIDSRTDDAKNKLQELQTYCLEKITAIHKASG